MSTKTIPYDYTQEIAVTTVKEVESVTPCHTKILDRGAIGVYCMNHH